ncbi:MAG: hypothetical protein NZ602_09265 [Thermoguttaceae bacterium]|nr:hypothetical protein [Thermoguttaceae bacterium]
MIQVYSFWLPKEGNRPEEYEDAFALDEVQRRFAIADGATESGYAGLWAKLLVDQWVRRPPFDFSTQGSKLVQKHQSWRRWLRSLRAEWLAQVARPNLPWYAIHKIHQGAFATFLGVY